MFSYEEKLPLQVAQVKPDPLLYELLDHQLHGCQNGLAQATVYMRQGFMIHNPKFHHTFLQLAVEKLNTMELLSDLLHQLHGEDDRYYDESNDDTPVFEFIPPIHEFKSDGDVKHHVNNDLTAALMRDIADEEKQRTAYERLFEKTKDEATLEIFHYLKDCSDKVLKTLKTMLTILTTHTEEKDFGEGNMHDEWDLDTSNYFDKPNPYFFNQTDKLTRK